MSIRNIVKVMNFHALIRVSFLEKQIDKETANMNLQQAIETYEWALKGYMK